VVGSAFGRIGQGRDHAANTLRAYRADWRDFSPVVRQTGRPALPAEAATVGSYLVTARHPTTAMLAGCDQHRASRKATPLCTCTLRTLLHRDGASLIRPARDRALLLLGLASALRRSELAALTVAEGVKLSVAALRTWLATAGITDGAAFRAVDRYGRTATSLERGGVGFVLW
jgi:site-specific recombinase XerD